MPVRDLIDDHGQAVGQIRQRDRQGDRQSHSLSAVRSPARPLGGFGPIFKFSETWQLVINTGTTIITFLMVFLIQNAQNRDGAALQTKLDELILASNAENQFMGIGS